MIHSSPVCSPGALTQEGKCFSINYFDEAGPRAQRARGSEEKLSTFCSAVTQPCSVEEFTAICVLNQSKDKLK